jgi:hypothetical protein
VDGQNFLMGGSGHEDSELVTFPIRERCPSVIASSDDWRRDWRGITGRGITGRNNPQKVAAQMDTQTLFVFLS